MDVVVGGLEGDDEPESARGLRGRGSDRDDAGAGEPLGEWPDDVEPLGEWPDDGRSVLGGRVAGVSGTPPDAGPASSSQAALSANSTKRRTVLAAVNVR